MTQEKLRQATAQCKCGSWYRRGNVCNKCDTVCNKCDTVCNDPPERELRYTGVSNTGRQWSKVKHRYLTDKELKQGQRGG